MLIVWMYLAAWCRSTTHWCSVPFFPPYPPSFSFSSLFHVDNFYLCIKIIDTLSALSYLLLILSTVYFFLGDYIFLLLDLNILYPSIYYISLMNRLMIFSIFLNVWMYLQMLFWLTCLLISVCLHGFFFLMMGYLFAFLSIPYKYFIGNQTLCVLFYRLDVFIIFWILW